MWKAIKQEGEMGYGQPTYLVQVIKSDHIIPEDGELFHRENVLVHEHEFEQVTTNKSTGEVKIHNYSRIKSVKVTRVALPYKWSTNLEHVYGRRCITIQFNDRSLRGITLWHKDHDLVHVSRSDGNYRRRKVALHRDHPTIDYALVSATCFSDVAAYANYFGDRLPVEFYEKYKDILVWEE